MSILIRKTVTWTNAELQEFKRWKCFQDPVLDRLNGINVTNWLIEKVNGGEKSYVIPWELKKSVKAIKEADCLVVEIERE
ncbi:hypothetical protein CTI12_AA161820 [Artemisia annua]|uniref:Uncharacterized protein n=1 Tax=Artemisia annua TaxID=35608 RepID=A0A2U1PDQ6_ARTAN|nr:hypothetical protein CTI12_AA161820 [Artemisia annua]